MRQMASERILVLPHPCGWPRHPMRPIIMRGEVMTANTERTVTRRTALAGLGAGGLGVALATTTRHASAQDTAAAMAHHPLVGTWLSGTTPNDISLNYWGADGSMTLQTIIVPGKSDG